MKTRKSRVGEGHKAKCRGYTKLGPKSRRGLRKTNNIGRGIWVKKYRGMGYVDKKTGAGAEGMRQACRGYSKKDF